MKSTRVLFITTSHDKLGNTAGRTGVWLEELAAPYYIFKDAGAQLTIASPNGGLVPLDPKSESIMVITRNTKRFVKDEEAMNFLSHSMLLAEISADDFDVVFITGGHGSMWDLSNNKILKELLEAFNHQNKPIGSVCHGVVGLLSLQDDNGQVLVKGKQLTCFSDSEEKSAGLTSVVPFLLESEFRTAGVSYSKGPDYESHVMSDGNLITGQNAASSAEVAKKLVALLQYNRQHPATVG